MTRAREWDMRPLMMECDRGRLQESLLVSGPGLRSGWPALAAKKHSNKRIIYWRRKEGEAERVVRGDTVQRHFRTVRVKHWPHLNIHSQCVTFPLRPPHWHSQQPQPICFHRSHLPAFIFIVRPMMTPPAPIVCQSGHSPLKPNRTVCRPGVGKLRPYTGAICGRLRFLFIPSSLKKWDW